MLKIVNRDTEARLVERVEAVGADAKAWRGLHFQFSRLLEHYRSDYQVKIAINLLSDLLKTADGTLFLCADSDIFILVKGAQKHVIEKVVFQLRYLFMDDPLAYNTEGQEGVDFCHIYDLSVAWEDFMRACRRKFGHNAKQEVTETIMQAGVDAARGANANRIKALTPQRLSSFERDLLPADISRTLRRQPVCAAQQGKKIRKVFDEIYINISHLRQLLLADVDMMSNRNLFKYITQILDTKVLEWLRRQQSFETPVSLNLNVTTLLSEAFAKFDAALKPSDKVSVVIEIHVSDVFQDMEAFLTARRMLQKEGYRVCLDGLTPVSFMQVNREQLGFDLAKLQWTADQESDLGSRENRALVEAVKRCGPSRVILCRCDTRQAIDFGHGMGISLFQGRFLDKVINPNAKVEN